VRVCVSREFPVRTDVSRRPGAFHILHIMTSPAGSRPGSPARNSIDPSSLVDPFPALDNMSPMQQHHYPHLHVHNTIHPTQFSPLTHEEDDEDDEGDVSPPSTISAQVLLPFLNTALSGTFKTSSTMSAATSNGQHSRGATARVNAMASLSRSSSGRQRTSRSEGELTKEYKEILGDGTVTPESLEKLRGLAKERGVPGQLRKVRSPSRVTMLTVVCLADIACVMRSTSRH